MATRKPRASKRTVVPLGPRKKKTADRNSATAAKLGQRRAPETLRLRSFEPGLTVNDLDKSVRFYTDVLGFIVSDRWTDGGVLRGVVLKAGVCNLNLSRDDWAKGRDRKKGEGVRLWCKTAQDIDILAQRIRAAGEPLAEEAKDQPWGVRSLSVDDPDGFHLTIYRERQAQTA